MGTTPTPESTALTPGVDAPSTRPQVADPLVVAIDGPSGSGKSSTARGVARSLHLAYLDTGSMYRALTVAYLRRGLTPEQQDQIEQLTALELRVGTDPDQPRVELEGDDVSQAIRDQRVSQAVSVLATNLTVRRVLTEQMRRIVADHGHRIVVEGRDITTVVCPDAQVRVLLVADPAARMARRGAELKGAADGERLRDQILRRDRDDSTVSQFEQPAPGVTLIDSTHLGLDEVVAAIVDLAERLD